MSQALYSKYRPLTFDQICGQTPIVQTLKHAVESGSVSHSLLFCGPRGTGKTTSARVLARSLLCEQAPTVSPDLTCPYCEEIALGNHPDLIELDAASRTGVDNVREEIIERVVFSPVQGKYKIYIIDEAHMLSKAAFNALLKTLEEPPAHIIFVLATTDPQKLPATIISRCQRYDFKPLSQADLVKQLSDIAAGEGWTVVPEALEFMAEQSRGGMRDAIGYLEQAGTLAQALSPDGKAAITLELTKQLLDSADSALVLSLIKSIVLEDSVALLADMKQLGETAIDLPALLRQLVEYINICYWITLNLNASLDDIAVSFKTSPQDAASLHKLSSELVNSGGEAVSAKLQQSLVTFNDVLSELSIPGSLAAHSPSLAFQIALTKLNTLNLSTATIETESSQVEQRSQTLTADRSPSNSITDVSGADAGVVTEPIATEVAVAEPIIAEPVKSKPTDSVEDILAADWGIEL